MKVHALIHQLREIADELEQLASVGAGSLPVSRSNETWQEEDAQERNTRSTARKRWVYFVRAGNLVKIGCSINPRKRLSSMQSGCPTELELVAVVPGDRDMESSLHDLLADCRVRGEWFELPEDMLKAIVERWG
jgi:hypothetical protein